MATRQRPLTSSGREIGEELAEWGKVALIETVGRVSGKPATTAVGFVERHDGSLFVAAGEETSDWALNLRAHPRARATIADETAAYAAEELTGAERATAVVELILKYGTPAERLGRGPAFKLRRADRQPTPQADRRSSAVRKIGRSRHSSAKGAT